MTAGIFQNSWVDTGRKRGSEGGGYFSGSEGVGVGSLDCYGIGRIGGKFSAIFCNRIKTQDVGTTKKGGGGVEEIRLNGQWEAGTEIPSPSPHLMLAY